MLIRLPELFGPTIKNLNMNYLTGDTADFLNEIPWFDGIIYILMIMGLYVFYKWINSKLISL